MVSLQDGGKVAPIEGKFEGMSTLFENFCMVSVEARLKVKLGSHVAQMVHVLKSNVKVFDPKCYTYNGFWGRIP